MALLQHSIASSCLCRLTNALHLISYASKYVGSNAIALLQNPIFWLKSIVLFNALL